MTTVLEQSPAPSGEVVTTKDPGVLVMNNAGLFHVNRNIRFAGIGPVNMGYVHETACQLSKGEIVVITTEVCGELFRCASIDDLRRLHCAGYGTPADWEVRHPSG